jgi:hypothetical protein
LQSWANSIEKHGMNIKKVFLNLTAVFFIFSQVLAGIFNYGFQIYASRVMGVVDFGQWSQWLASFSVACFFGVWLQSLSVISGFYHWVGLRRFRFFLAALTILFVVFFFLRQLGLLSAIGWGASLLSGVLTGYCLRVQSLRLIAIVSLFAAVSKFLWVFVESTKESFYVAILFAPIVSSLIYLLGIKSSAKDGAVSKGEISNQVVMASLALAFFSTWAPQVDLLLLHNILSNEEYGLFAKVALLSKGFFFGFQILAQMLLAHQVGSGENVLTVKNIALFSVGGILLALVAGVIASGINWPGWWTALSLLHATTLCLLVMLIQSYSAQKLGKKSAVVCVMTAVAGFAISRLVRSAESYLIAVVVTEAMLVFYLSITGKSDLAPAKGRG